MNETPTKPETPTPSSVLSPAEEARQKEIAEEYRRFSTRVFICWLATLAIMLGMTVLKFEANQVLGLGKASIFFFCLWFGMTEIVFGWIYRLKWRDTLGMLLIVYMIFQFRRQLPMVAAAVAVSFLLDRFWLNPRPRA